MEELIIRGAREHNLKNVDLTIPKNKLIVFTGVSGSGKSSLAMDTIYAEGQRRYVESLSSYARQFLGVMDKPDVDLIEGLSPAIAIDQKSASHNPRSTVGTITEVYDYLRLLYARVGHPHCPNCGREISRQTIDQISDGILALGPGRYMIISPIVKDRKGEYTHLFENLRKQGFGRARVDGQVISLDSDFDLIKTNKHTIEAVIDRLVLEKKVSKDTITRIRQSVETALKLADGVAIVSQVTDKAFEFPESPKKMEDHLFSERFACPFCNISLPELEPRSFSFNSPHGACPKCQGLGTELKINPAIIYNPDLSVREGGIFPWANVMEHETWSGRLLETVAKTNNIDLSVPISQLSDSQLHLILYGTGKTAYAVNGKNRFGKERTYDTTFEGIIPNLERRYKETDSDYIRREIERYMVKELCPLCKGVRLKKEVLGVTILDLNIAEASNLTIKKFLDWSADFKTLNSREQEIGKAIIKEIDARLNFLLDVGLDYLTIDRAANTLAGGEAQRIRLASQIGSGLSGVLYVLDEPSIGLHQRDQDRLIQTLKRLRDLGNTVIVVEHDEQTMLESDYIVDFGPGAGEHGGEILAQGTPDEIKANKKSITGAYLSGRRQITVPNFNQEEIDVKVKPSSRELVLMNASHNNLKNVTIKIPLAKLVCVTGVSGSGKSSLINETLLRQLRQEFNLKNEEKPGANDGITGLEYIDKVVDIDQSPIGRTPRSNPATYTKAFDEIRELFASTRESQLRGYKSGRFSFNVKGGRCEACKGDGQIKIEMQFMPDIYIDCEVCDGRRYNHEALEIEYKGKNISQVLDMTIDEAAIFFTNHPGIKNKLDTLQDVGLGYVHLGQPAPTLSGGEAQRIKLASELSRRQTGKTLYILDEPTTGLHFADLERLIAIFKRLVSYGNSVIVIEHNLDVIRFADHIIDLGPEGGVGGGRVIVTGTVAEVVACQESWTGKYLKAKL
ncbi:MAG: excinuclease ABC subunit UvrA [candidate division WWE3 bacterium]|nr:excinuclease ABC subunit UvrA [candidate division WWE3 bacterium]